MTRAAHGCGQPKHRHRVHDGAPPPSFEPTRDLQTRPSIKGQNLPSVCTKPANTASPTWPTSSRSRGQPSTARSTEHAQRRSRSSFPSGDTFLASRPVSSSRRSSNQRCDKNSVDHGAQPRPRRNGLTTASLGQIADTSCGLGEQPHGPGSSRSHGDQNAHSKRRRRHAYPAGRMVDGCTGCAWGSITVELST